MSSRNLFLRRGWVSENAPLKNGMGRFIPQLARLTIKFCKERATSAGVREFIEKDLVEFAKKNPHCAIYLKPRRNRASVIVSEYLNGERNWQLIDKISRDELSQWLDVHRNASGKEYQVQTKYHYSEHPSIQGVWNIHTNQDPELALASHPDPQSSLTRSQRMSATERVKQMFAEQKLRAELQQGDEEQLDQTKQGPSN